MRKGLIAVVSLAVSACAMNSASSGNGQLSSLLDSDWRPAGDQTCVLLTDAVPSLEPESFIDTSNLTSRSDGYAVLEVQYDSSGARTAARVLETTLPDGDSQSLLRAVRDRLPHRPGEWQAGLLRIEMGGESTVTLGPAEYCACSLRNRSQLSRLLNEAVQEVNNPRLAGTRHRVVIDVRSDGHGRILEKRISEGSRYEEVNRIVAHLADRLDVSPPLLNRQPQDRWSRLPITIVFPAASGSDDS